MATQVFYTQSLETKKGSRIWLEGKRLEDAGFGPGQKYQVIYNREQKRLELIATSAGERIVSKKSRYDQILPIIDICNDSVTKIFGPGTPVVAKVQDGRIVITQHQIESNRRIRESEMAMLLNNDGEVLEGSLCSGGGVSTHAIHEGMKSAGVNSKVSLLAEYDPRYLQVAKRLFPYVETIHQGKIEDVLLEDIPRLNVLSFSLPCTGHSIAGKTKNKIKTAEEHKDASTAVFGALKYIVQSNPAVIISENVIQAKDSATYILLKAEIKRIGYEIKEFILDEKQAGSIEKRKRYWFVAISSGFKSVLNEIEPKIYSKKYNTVGEALDKDYSGDWMPASYYDSRLEKNIQNGRGFSKNFATDNTEQTNVITRHYTKRQISNPHYHKGDKIRLFTVAEHARLMGIPEMILEGVADTVGHEILGQSILYNQAHGLSSAVMAAIKNLVAEKKEKVIQVAG